MYNYFVSDNKYVFEVRHMFLPSYYDTVDELVDAYKPILDWLADNIKGYTLRPLDNAAFSDVNEDYWVGYYVIFYDETDAMAFRLQWLK
jgi:hypothetical protein